MISYTKAILFCIVGLYNAGSTMEIRDVKEITEADE